MKTVDYTAWTNTRLKVTDKHATVKLQNFNLFQNMTLVFVGDSRGRQMATEIGSLLPNDKFNKSR